MQCYQTKKAYNDSALFIPEHESSLEAMYLLVPTENEHIATISIEFSPSDFLSVLFSEVDYVCYVSSKMLKSFSFLVDVS